MNRVLILIVLLACFCSLANSQFVNHYGLRLGLSSASQSWNVAGHNNQGINSRLGMDIGAFVESFERPFFTLSTEMHYIQKGFKESIPITTDEHPDGTGEFLEHNIRLDYVSLAVLPKLRLTFQDFDLFVLMGPRVDFFVTSSVEIEGPDQYRKLELQTYQSLVDRFTTPQFGGTFGFGLQSASFFSLVTGAEIRYSPNFQSVYSNSAWDIKNNSFEFLFTIGL